jgi:hypothetical protein
MNSSNTIGKISTTGNLFIMKTLLLKFELIIWGGGNTTSQNGYKKNIFMSIKKGKNECRSIYKTDDVLKIQM